jgi:hypothetical protein
MATIFMQNIVLGFGKFLASLEPSPGGATYRRPFEKESSMNAFQRMFTLAMAASLVAVAGAARATTSDTPASPTAMPPSSSEAPTNSSTPATPPTTSDTPKDTAPDNAATSPNVDARRIFDQLDANHDGTLTFEEFSRATFRSK